MVKYTIMYTPKEGEDTRRNPQKHPSKYPQQKHPRQRGAGLVSIEM